MQSVIRTLSRKVSVGYISFDHELSQTLTNNQAGKNYSQVITPLICSFFATYTNDNPQYSGYQQEIEYTDSASYQSLLRSLEEISPEHRQLFEKLVQPRQSVSVGPTKIPSIMGLTDFEKTQTQFLSPVLDMSLRIFSAMYDVQVRGRDDAIRFF